MRSRRFATQVAWVALSVTLTLGLVATAFGQTESRREEQHRRLDRSTAARISGQEPSSPAVPDGELELAVQRLLASPSEGPVPTAASALVQAERPHLLRSRAGYVQAFSAPPGRPSPLSRPETDAGDAARRFLRDHARAFGVARQGTAFEGTRVKTRGQQRYVGLRQRFSGIPVFGSGVVVQLDAAGNVAFALLDVGRDNAEFHRADFDTQPSVPSISARELALAILQAQQGADDLEATDPELMIYEPSVIGNAGPSRLVWHVQVTSASSRVNEIVLVDAQTEEIAFRFSQIMEAKSRSIYDAGNVPGSLGTLARWEGQPPTGLSDVDFAYDYFGDTYDFYSTWFGRDGIDGAGGAMIGRVRYCVSGLPCPYANAYWNGSEMRFGQGYSTADDVVGHELTHGVTNYESNLIYWGDSGAINEALSDIFGELLDLTNGAGNDGAGARWLMGEDLPGGAIRSMSDPTIYGDPDRRLSPNWSYSVSDNLGVHSNSGVANKLAYLLTDGDTFNGQTVTGLGANDVAALFYEAQTNLLVPGADYFDLYAVLKQAAINLSWAPEARSALEWACRATEIAVPGNVQTMFSDGFEGSFPGSWDVQDLSGVGTAWGRSTDYAALGAASVWCAGGGSAPQPPYSNYVSDMYTWLIYGPFSLSDAKAAWVEFDLIMNSEYGYDNLFWGISTNGSDFSGIAVSGPSYGWVHELFNFQEMTAINALGQPNVWFAIAFASDTFVEYEGVYVDNFFLKKAASAPPFGSFDTPADGASGMTGNIPVSGWALDDDEVTKVEIYRDPVSGESGGPNGKIYIGDATFVPGARPDVDAALTSYPFSFQAGWGYMLLTNFLPNSGNGTFTLYAYAYDGNGNTTELGSKTISVSNSTGTKPFGTLDTPFQGDTSSGTFQNWGWALTPQPAAIPTDGSTIWVYVDGAPLGNPVYNLYRADIATLFPGYANTDGAVGYFVLDTTSLSNGLHTIAWIVTDDQGHSDGIGSRFFWVDN